MNTKLSVIVASYNRRELTARAMHWYARQSFRDFEYLLCDDHSEEDLKGLCDEYRDRGLNVRYFHAGRDLGLPKKPGEWRDGSALRNALSVQARGTVLVSSHPEIVPTEDALEVAWEAVNREPGAWWTAMPFWVPEGDYEQVDWRTDVHAFQNVPGFYDPTWTEPRPGIDYANNHQAVRLTWESEVWWAVSTRLYRRIGGMRTFTVWGPPDVDLMNRRRAIGIPTRLLKSAKSPNPSGTLPVYHQWHESPRSMDLCMDTLRDQKCVYGSAEEAIRAGGLFDLYYSGMRERRADGYEVIGDHVARYAFAKQFADKKSVLDVAMGTGYGAEVVGPVAARYAGVDCDGESVAWAHEKYSAVNRDYHQAVSTDLPFPDATFDVVTYFEGLEHIPPDEQKATLAEIDRVLKPDGVLVMSTPVKGVAPGTVFDRFLVSVPELDELLATHFRSVVRHHQMNYGPAELNPVVEGTNPNALIQIVVARKS
jgi:SAM-dependent methyltransferase